MRVLVLAFTLLIAENFEQLPILSKYLLIRFAGVMFSFSP